MASLAGADANIRFVHLPQTRTGAALDLHAAAVDTATVHILLAAMTTNATLGECAVNRKIQVNRSLGAVLVAGITAADHCLMAFHEVFAPGHTIRLRRVIIAVEAAMAAFAAIVIGIGERDATEYEEQ